ncbi:DUF4347 domain-containing protein [Marinifilum sp. JC120]|nr:DUF4347 domain-containing protein [Marinifilum sp. JC120]
MRLEERIVLDGAAAVVVEHAAQAMADVHVVDTANDANAAQDSHAAHEAKETAQADSGPADTADAPDVAALLKVVAPQENQPVNAVAPIKDKTGSSTAENNSQPEEDPVTVLVASSGLADVNDLLGAAKENVVTVTYDGDTDNPDEIFNKIESALDGKQAASIGFASHSIGSGSIHLGGDYSVDADTLISNPEMTEFWKNVGSLVEPDGHIDLLGCGVADGEIGKDFIAKLEQVTGREIAASIDDTGNAQSGGNWLLEEGGVDLAELYFDSGKLGEFDGVLATPYITTSLSHLKFYDTDRDGFYEIDSAEKLIALSITNDRRDWQTHNFELTKDIVFDSDESKVDWSGDGRLGDAEDLKGFKPIGHPFVAFNVDFEGNGYSIKNLYINRPTQDYVGLFGSASGGSIDNVGLIDVKITGNEYTGGLVGKSESTITNSSVTGNITGSSHTAGLVGGGVASIANCYFTGNVQGEHYVGGLIGYLGDNVGSSAKVTSCHASGSVTGVSACGGLIGRIYGSGGDFTVSDSYSSGFVSNTLQKIGGLIGEVYSGVGGNFLIQSSYSTSFVDGNTSVGGLIGMIGGKGDYNVTNTYASGNVKGFNSVGGLIGFSLGANIRLSSALNSQVENTSKAGTGRVVGANDKGSIFGNSANSSMRTIGWDVADEDKGADTLDGKDVSSSPYNAYKDWDQTIWKFPSSHDAHPALRSERIVLPTSESKLEPEVIVDPVNPIVINSNTDLTNTQEIFVREIKNKWNDSIKPYLTNITNKINAELSKVSSFFDYHELTRSEAGLRFVKAVSNPENMVEIYSSLEDYISTFSPDETKEKGWLFDSIQYAEMAEAVYSKERNNVMGWDLISRVDEEISGLDESASYAHNFSSSDSDLQKKIENTFIKIATKYKEKATFEAKDSVYDSLYELGGFIFEKQQEVMLLGLEAGVYKKGNHVTLAFAGTNELTDWIANVSPDDMNTHKELALEIAKVVIDHYGDDITIVGHSLGGYLVQEVVHDLNLYYGKKNIDGVAFNAKSGRENNKHVQVMNIKSDGDVVQHLTNKLSSNIGNEEHTISDGGWHMMDTLSDAMKRDLVLKTVVDVVVNNN